MEEFITAYPGNCYSTCSFRVPVEKIKPGEFIDRLIYYYDFDPVSISTIINNHVIDLRNEKKSG